MPELDKGFIDGIVGTLFAEGHGFLETVESDGGIVQGTFNFENRPYYKIQLPNFTSLDTEYAIAQLGFVAFGYWIKKGYFDFVTPDQRKNVVRTLFNHVKIGDLHKSFGERILVNDSVRARIVVGEFHEGNRSYLSKGTMYFNGGLQQSEFDVAFLK